MKPQMNWKPLAAGFVTLLLTVFACYLLTGPLARALNFLDDARKALARRREYAAWLCGYVDISDGRRWHELSDTQTWHKNSPCYQAFAKAFPKEDLVKSALMDARAQLERETAN